MSFNSLQTGKAFRTKPTLRDCYPIMFEFQFPSNGKGFLNSKTKWMDMIQNTFQFPSNGKRLFRTPKNRNGSILHLSSFNSLQTGKAFPNLKFMSSRLSTKVVFNSLQTGKAFRTKTPSNRNCRKHLTSFNSLQTGKGFPNESVEVDTPETPEGFQFPSNGKGFPNFFSKEIHE